MTTPAARAVRPRSRRHRRRRGPGPRAALRPGAAGADAGLGRIGGAVRDGLALPAAGRGILDPFPHERASTQHLDRPTRSGAAGGAGRPDPAGRPANHTNRTRGCSPCFRHAGRPRDAAELALRQRALCPHAPVIGDAGLADLLAEAVPLAVAAPKPAGQVQTLFPRTQRPAHTWRSYGNGVPNCLKELQAPCRARRRQRGRAHRRRGAGRPTTRWPCSSADGAIQTELSVGRVPTLLRAPLRRTGAGPASRRPQVAARRGGAAQRPVSHAQSLPFPVRPRPAAAAVSPGRRRSGGGDA